MTVGDLFSWDLPALNRHFSNYLPGVAAPKTKDGIRQKLLKALLAAGLVQEQIAASEDVPSSPVEGSAPPTPVSSHPTDVPGNATSQTSGWTGLRAQVDALTQDLASVTAQTADLRATVATLSTLVQEILTQTKQRDTNVEQAERTARRCNLRLTNLPETADALADAHKLFESMGCAVQLTQARRLGPSPGSYAAKVAGSGDAQTSKPRPIIVTMASFADKLCVLRSRKSLKDSPFSSTGIDDDLTPLQLQMKRAVWPAYVEARKEGKKAYWRAHELFIDGKLHTTSTQ